MVRTTYGVALSTLKIELIKDDCVDLKEWEDKVDKLRLEIQEAYTMYIKIYNNLKLEEGECNKIISNVCVRFAEQQSVPKN